MREHRTTQPPVVLVKWYDFVKWLLERVDSFPKNQRFIFGQRLADNAIRVLELLVEAAYSRSKIELLKRANRQIEMLRWLVRLAKDRKLFTVRQYGFACKALTECGRMVGGWLKQAAEKEGSTDAPPQAAFSTDHLLGERDGRRLRGPAGEADTTDRRGVPGEL